MWFNHRMMRPNDADWLANSVDSDQIGSSLIWVYTVCPGLSIWKLRIITVQNKSFSYQDTLPLHSLLVCILNFDNKTSKIFSKCNHLQGSPFKRYVWDP